MGKVTVTLTGDASNLLRALKQAENAQDGLGRAVQRTAKESTGATDAMVAGLTAVASVAASALANLRELSQVEADRQRQAAKGFAELAQLSGGDINATIENAIQARVLFGQGVGSSQDEASKLVFALKSAGANSPETRQMFADFGNTIDNPAQFGQSLRQLQAGFGDESGSIRELASKVLKASEDSPSTAPELAAAAAGTGELARSLGIPVEEALALTAIIAEKSSASEARTRVNALLKAVAQDKRSTQAAQEGGLVGVSDSLSARGLADLPKFSGVFGDRLEAFQGASALMASRDLVTERAAGIGAAAGEDFAGSIASSAGDPATIADRQVRISEARRVLAAEVRAERQNIYKSVLKDEEARLITKAETGTETERRLASAELAAFRMLHEGEIPLIGIGAEDLTSEQAKEEIISGGSSGSFGLADGFSTGGPERLDPIRRQEEVTKEVQRRLKAADRGTPSGVSAGGGGGARGMTPGVMNAGKILQGLHNLFGGDDDTRFELGGSFHREVRSAIGADTVKGFDGMALPFPEQLPNTFALDFDKIDKDSNVAAQLERSHAFAMARESRAAAHARAGTGNDAPPIVRHHLKTDAEATKELMGFRGLTGVKHRAITGTSDEILAAAGGLVGPGNNGGWLGAAPDELVKEMRATRIASERTARPKPIAPDPRNP